MGRYFLYGTILRIRERVNFWLAGELSGIRKLYWRNMRLSLEFLRLMERSTDTLFPSGAAMRRLTIFCFLLVAICFHAFTASASTRHVESFTSGWRFLQSDAVGAQAPSFDDSSWKTV